MSFDFTFEDLFDDATYQYIVKETNFLIDRRRQQKKRSREWRKYRNSEIAAGRPDPGRNKYTPNRYYSRKLKKEKVKVTTPVPPPPPPPPSAMELPSVPEIPANILAELDQITDIPEIPVNILDEILNETNESGGDA
tara:strand:- start:7608 stop:8018 length:411 start_codon:yes stop_codon:yes gene_type:complete